VGVLSIKVRKRGDDCAIFFKIRHNVLLRSELEEAVREIVEKVKVYRCRRVLLSGVGPTWLYGSVAIDLSHIVDELATYLPYKDVFIKVFPVSESGEYVGDHVWFE